jgi:hypothetical protein
MDLYVSPVKGHVVTRYGTASSKRVKGPVDPKTGKATFKILSNNNQVIGGARRRAVVEKTVAPNGSTFDLTQRPFEEADPEVVEMIPAAEYAQFRKHYDRSLAEGALTRRTKADYDAYLNAQATGTTRKALAIKDAARKKALAEKAKTDAAAAKQLAAEAAQEAEQASEENTEASA